MILEYLYFAPPSGEDQYIRDFRYLMSEALSKVRNERSLVMLKFDLENQIEAIPNAKPGEGLLRSSGGDIWRLLDYRTSEAFAIAASFMHYAEVRKHISVRLDGFRSDTIPYRENP